VDPHDCEDETQQTVRCIFGDSNEVLEVPPDPNTLMIMEVQLPISKDLNVNAGNTETYGWT
jgi:hypothetical protein